MKKLLAIILAAVLVVSCSVVTFSAAETAEKELVSIEMTQLPDKLEYEFDSEAYFDFDNIDYENEPETLEEIIQLLEQVYFVIDVDLTGAEITATYNDGSTELIDNELCTTSVADSINVKSFYEAMLNVESEEDYEEVMAMLIREYTINVTYKTAETSFKVNVTEPDYSEKYELVSVTNPNKNTYVIEDDLYFDEDLEITYVDLDLTGMVVTVLNKETGEILTFDSDDVELEYFFFDDEEIKPGSYETMGYIIIDEDEYDCVFFDYEFELVNAEKQEETTQPTTEKTDDSEIVTTSPTQSATTASVSETQKETTIATSNNDAVKTGVSLNTGILVVLMLSGAIFAILAYRKKIVE